MLRQAQHERISNWFNEITVRAELVEVQFLEVPLNVGAGLARESEGFLVADKAGSYLYEYILLI